MVYILLICVKFVNIYYILTDYLRYFSYGFNKLFRFIN
jgi:hypothetical protein